MLLDCDSIFHDEAENLMMTEVCGATNCTMMEVGEAISCMMKVCGATKSTVKCQVI